MVSAQTKLEIYASSNPIDYEVADCPDWPRPPEPPKTKSGRPLATLIVRPYWVFHKTDTDPWPSLLHGHHSEKPLKLDAITGFIYHIHTRKHVQSLRLKALFPIQKQLRMSKDFGDRALVLIGPV
jgi:hypothetical protein